jgi:hypothetical protein
MFPITAGLGALSYLTSLLQSSTAATSSSQSGDPLSQLTQGLDSDGDGDQSPTAAASVGSGGTTQPFAAGTLAGLLSLQVQGSNSSNGQAPPNLFSKLDGNGDGQISQSEFESGLGSAGVDSSSADALFNNIDANGDGSVSQDELIAARQTSHPFVGMGLLPNSALANSATTQTVTNADGSTTTTITYPDGSNVSTTTPASMSTSGNDASGSSGSGTSSQSNLLEQLVQMQSQFLSQSASTLSTVA